MKVFIVLTVCAALVAAKNENGEKQRDVRGIAQFAQVGIAAAPAPLLAKGIAPVAYANYPQFAFAPQFAPQFAAQFAPQYAQAPLAYGPAAYASYAAPAYAPAPVAAAVAAAPVAVSEPYKSTGPQTYAQQVPAAAIRNVETVGVTKTITPVVTKTTTYNTHSEPALSVGHVQGYSQSAHGPGKIAPVQYNTVYTQYLNPTVGVNGPVTYAGPAVGQGVAVQQGVAVAPAPQPVAYAAAAPAGLAYSPQFFAAAPAPQFLAAAAPQYLAAAPQYLAAAAPAPQYFAAAAAAPAPAQPPQNTYGPPTNTYGPPSNNYGPPNSGKF